MEILYKNDVLTQIMFLPSRLLICQFTLFNGTKLVLLYANLLYLVILSLNGDICLQVLSGKLFK